MHGVKCPPTYLSTHPTFRLVQGPNNQLPKIWIEIPGVDEWFEVGGNAGVRSSPGVCMGGLCVHADLCDMTWHVPKVCGCCWGVSQGKARQASLQCW
jgi:hypothetical protein